MILGYVRGLLADNPMLAELVTTEGVEHVGSAALRYRSKYTQVITAARAVER